MRRYDQIFSIGSQCLTGVMMQQAQLKSSSGPFDWIFSSLPMVNDCLVDDFAAFLDRSQHIPIPLHARPAPDMCYCDHRIFQDRYGLNSIFNHSDPTQQDVYDYFVRCVDRFRAALTARCAGLLLGMFPPDRASRPDIRRLIRRLEHRGAAEALIVMIGRQRESPRLILRDEGPRHRLFVFNPSSELRGIQFAETRDNRFLIDWLRENIAVESAASDDHSAARNVSAA
jgi:hypothetical protein